MPFYIDGIRAFRDFWAGRYVKTLNLMGNVKK
jgi:hypothetical protein